MASPTENLQEGLRAVLSGLEFPAAQGIYAEGERVAIEVIAHPNRPGGHCNLEVTVIPLAAPGEIDAEVEAGAHEAFEEALGDPHPGIRVAAQHELDRLKWPRGHGESLNDWVFLVQERSDLGGPILLPEAVTDRYGRALLQNVAPDATVALQLRPACARSALPPVPSAEQRQRLLEATTDPSDEVRIEAAGHLGRLGRMAASEEVLSHLAAMLRDPKAVVRSVAAAALGALGTAADTPRIVEGLRLLEGGPSPGDRAAAVQALKSITQGAGLSLAAAEDHRGITDPAGGTASAHYRLPDRRISAAVIELPGGVAALTIETPVSQLAGSIVRFALGREYGEMRLSPVHGLWNATLLLEQPYEIAGQLIPAFELAASCCQGVEPRE